MLRIALGNVCHEQAVRRALGKAMNYKGGMLGELNLAGHVLMRSNAVPLYHDQIVGFRGGFDSAQHRAQSALEATDADIGIGIELPLVKIGSNTFQVPTVVLVYPARQIVTRGLGTGMPIPKDIVEKAREHSLDIDHVVRQCTQRREKDPVRFLSLGIIGRVDTVEPAVLVTLTAAANQVLYEHEFADLNA